MSELVLVQIDQGQIKHCLIVALGRIRMSALVMNTNRKPYATDVRTPRWCVRFQPEIQSTLSPSTTYEAEHEGPRVS